MEYCTLIVLTFLVTAAYDAVLQLAGNGYLPIVEKLVGDSDWYISLTKPGGYFDQHTSLAAILLAGFVGACAQIIILKFSPFAPTFEFLLTTFVVSALFGLLMNDASPFSTRYFPVISRTYYKDLGVKRAMVTDGFSGLVVNATILLISAYTKM